MKVALLPRMERFLERPWNERRKVLAWHIRQVLSHVKRRALFVRRLEPGFWWIAWKDVISDSVLSGSFEAGERKFVQRFLRRGMTLLDIGAYYGLYTLTASVCVGNAGHVIAFEPSPFQRKRLLWHLRINNCENVRVENLALGATESDQTLFSICGESAGYSSLRRPVLGVSVEPIPVRVATLDEYLRVHQIGPVDFIKVDVEGGELDVFRGAQNLLRGEMRPVVLCELEDVRTEIWGHKAKDAAAFLEGFGFRWFRLLPDGSLAALGEKLPDQERNFVAVPDERRDQLKELLER